MIVILALAMLLARRLNPHLEGAVAAPARRWQAMQLHCHKWEAAHPATGVIQELPLRALRLTGRQPRSRDDPHVVTEGNFAAGNKCVTAGDVAVVAAGPHPTRRARAVSQQDSLVKNYC